MSENIAARLFAVGEFRQDGEIAVAVSRLLEIDRQVAEQLKLVFPNDPAQADPFAAYREAPQ